MMKRLTWFVAGTVTGAVGSGYAKRRVREAASQLTPRQVARSGADALRRRAGDVVSNVRGDRGVPPVSLAERLSPDEQVLVDGRPVDQGRIVVTRSRS